MEQNIYFDIVKCILEKYQQILEYITILLLTKNDKYCTTLVFLFVSRLEKF